MNEVKCFNKKSVTSLKTGTPRDFYFLCIQDSLGYSGDQIVQKGLWDKVNPPCVLEYVLDCSGNRPQVKFRVKGANNENS